MKKQIIIFLVTILLTVATSAQKQGDDKNDANTGIIYGKDHAFTLTSPKGWVLDNKSGVPQGLHAVFYPQGSSWHQGAAVMYASVWVKEDIKQTVEDVINSDIAKFKAASPSLKVKDAENIKLDKDKRAIEKHFSSDAKDQNFEAIAYIDEGKTVVLVVLTSRTKKDFDSSLSAFRELVGSYMFLTDKVVIQK